MAGEIQTGASDHAAQIGLRGPELHASTDGGAQGMFTHDCVIPQGRHEAKEAPPPAGNCPVAPL